MKHAARFSTFLLVLSLIGCDREAVFDPDDGDGGLVPASGHATVTGHIVLRPVPAVPNFDETTAFSAVRHKDGRVTGRWQAWDEHLPTGAKFRTHGQITCFTIEADGRTARIGGVVHRSDFGIPPGFHTLWTVVDNGEGRNAPPDVATDNIFGLDPAVRDWAGEHCAAGIDLSGRFGPLTGGNVQVRP